MIYLDNSATTYPKPECVYKVLDDANRERAFNAGRGTYKSAKETFKMIEDTRRKIGRIINVNSDKVAFFSSATEALNIIINGLDIKDGDNIYISCFEHNAIVRPLYNLQKTIDFNILFIPFQRDTWDVNLTELNNLFVMNKPKAILISHISNVTGFILPYQKIFALSKNYQSINILDSAQSFGILNPNKTNCDFIVFAGHKSLYASFGIAGFINVNDILLKIVKSGGNGSDSLNHDMPKNGFHRYESGSQNSVAICGLNRSVDWLNGNDILHHEQELTKYLIDNLKLNKKIVMYLPKKNDNILGIVSINIEGYNSSDVGLILSDEYDICVRTGYHCSPFIHDFIGSISFGGTVRVSMGAFNSKKDIDILIDALKTF